MPEFAVTRSSLPPFPDGWYFVARSDELRRGRVVTRRLAAQDVVLFRTQSGAAHALPPHCPHLGAHLGHGGRVEGEALRCPMHGFCFDGAGSCVKSGYGRRPPKAARLRPLSLVERHGGVFVWHSESASAPGWELPRLEGDGFSALRTREMRFRSHPQETTENSVDLGHLSVLHRFDNVQATAPLHVEGPYLAASYSFDWSVGVPIRVHYTAHVHGLGYSFVDVHLHQLDIHLHQFVLPTPVDEGVLSLTLGVRMRLPGHAKIPARLRNGIPLRVARDLAATLVMLRYAREVTSDIAVWNHKRYLDQPALAEGDGPIGKYRRWARQFYGLESSVCTSP